MAEGGVISVQVLNEFVSVCLNKLKRPWSDINAALSVIRGAPLEILPLTVQMHDEARLLSLGHGIHIYDALLVAAARQAGCDTLLTEDLQHGRRFGELVVHNPFVA